MATWEVACLLYSSFVLCSSPLYLLTQMVIAFCRQELRKVDQQVLGANEPVVGLGILQVGVSKEASLLLSARAGV